MNKKETIIFVVIAYILGFALQLAALVKGLAEEGTVWLQLTMWAPAAAALLTGKASRAMLWKSCKKFNPAYFPIALLVGSSIVLLSALIGWIAGLAAWNQGNFQLSSDGTVIEKISGVSTMLGGGYQSLPFFLLNFALTISVASIIFGIFGGMGEELGWRSVLQPSLEKRFGSMKAALIVGLVWGYWHLPANLAGYNNADHPLLEAFLFMQIYTIALSFAYGWLFKKTGSGWLLGMAHITNNLLSSGGSVFVFKNNSSETLVELISSCIILGFFAILTWKSETSNTRSPENIGVAVAGNGMYRE
jgi:membrane protease YdiL (CAAX protease family)